VLRAGAAGRKVKIWVPTIGTGTQPMSGVSDLPEDEEEGFPATGARQPEHGEAAPARQAPAGIELGSGL
jgi:hypothetical protein